LKPKERVKSRLWFLFNREARRRMKNWKNWILVLLFLLLLGGFWLIWEKYPKEVVKVEVREDERKIDSLMLVIGEKSLVIDSLKKQKEMVIEKVVVKVEKIKDLPPNSTIKLFYNNLQDYGEVESTEPTLREDSSVICSLDNLKGANIITAKYEGKAEEVMILNDIVAASSEIVSNKDSIISQNSIILNKTREAYDQRLTELNKQLKKETRKKKIAVYGGAVLVGVLGGLLILK
jgi:hypothetical protein